jgi:site-specific DNA-cytosine methylase
MRVLELFSGTGSVGKVCKELGYDVVSLDIKDYKKYKPTHKIDILKWNYKTYNTGDFDIIWCSPPCIWYSNLQNTWINRMKIGEDGKKYLYTKERRAEDIEYADSLVKKCLEIIEYFKPQTWFMENPQTGLLKKRPFMEDLPYVDADYCKYSTYGYRKRTRFWTNKEGISLKLCNKDCENLQEHNGRFIHKRSLGGNKEHQKAVGGGSNRDDRYRIPPDLIKTLFPNNSIIR